MRQARGKLTFYLRFVEMAVIVTVTLAPCFVHSADKAGGGAESPRAVAFGCNAEISYHSNPYYRETATERSGTVMGVEPHVRLDMPANEYLYFGLLGKLTYTGVILDNDAGDEVGDRDVVHPYVAAKARYNTSEHTSLAVSDEYQQANVGDDITGDQYYLNQIRAEFAHEFGARFKAGLWYRNSVLKEDSSSLLYDFTDNSLGGEASYVVTRTAVGRDVTIAVTGNGGEKGFEDGDFLDQDTQTNPKNHTYYSAGMALLLPVSSAITADVRGGWKRREYDTVSQGREEKTDSLSFGAGLNMIPGGLISFVLTASYSIEDTIVYGGEDAQQEQAVFDALDPLMNNLNNSYREMEVRRVGARADYSLSDRTRLGLVTTYQHSEADREEDLTAISGQSGHVAVDLNEDRYTIGATVETSLTDTLSIAASYEHGLAEDDTRDLYGFDAAALIARFSL